MSTSSAVDHAEAIATAQQVADTVLYEGYVLYPYRASGQKNRMRWQWGVLVPEPSSESAAEPWDSQTECLIEPRADCELTVTWRFLQIRDRTVYRADGPDFVPVQALELADRQLVPWQEGVEREITTTVPISVLRKGGQVVPFEFAAGEETELVVEDGVVLGRLNRRSWELRGRLRLSVVPVEGPYGALRLRIVAENVTEQAPEGGSREELMRYAMAGAHAILTLDGGTFLSMADPPEWARYAAKECANRNTWPVLIGRGRADVMLSSPIILADYPEVAPESPGDLYDATEIDEILSLRTLALTDSEKREARGTDPRAAAVIDRVDAMPQEMLDKLHGAIRYLRGDKPTEPVTDPGDVPWWDPGADASVSPETDQIEVAGRLVGNGSRVRLCPGTHRADAQDFFLDGRTATVHAVFHDVDGNDHLAVTLEDDPAAEIAQTHGRYRYFRPDEVQPL